MMHYLPLGAGFVLSLCVIFFLSVFHAAAVEVSRKPRLAIVTDSRPASAADAEDARELAGAA